LLVVSSDLLLFDGAGRLRRIPAERFEFLPAALSPEGQIAYVRDGPNNTGEVFLGDGRKVFSGTGVFSDLAWSPDGRWLLIAWPTANQWVFVRVAGPRRIVAASAIARQFGGSFPRLAGWCC
jgi:hypothetical protein